MSNSEVNRGYYKNRNIMYKRYILNGKLHSENGPACIDYYENGNVQLEYYYLNGIKLTKEEWYSRLSTEQRVNLLCGKGNE